MDLVKADKVHEITFKGGIFIRALNTHGKQEADAMLDAFLVEAKVSDQAIHYDDNVENLSWLHTNSRERLRLAFTVDESTLPGAGLPRPIFNLPNPDQVAKTLTPQEQKEVQVEREAHSSMKRFMATMKRLGTTLSPNDKVFYRSRFLHQAKVRQIVTEKRGILMKTMEE